MKGSIRRVITQCSPFEVTRLFIETIRLHLQSLRVTQARNQHKAANKKILLFNFEDGENIFLWNVGSLSMDYTALYPRRYNLVLTFIYNI
jgi:hypothetical protein